jgi:hypothetical protein
MFTGSAAPAQGPELPGRVRCVVIFHARRDRQGITRSPRRTPTGCASLRRTKRCLPNGRAGTFEIPRSHAALEIAISTAIQVSRVQRRGTESHRKGFEGHGARRGTGPGPQEELVIHTLAPWGKFDPLAVPRLLPSGQTEALCTVDCSSAPWLAVSLRRRSPPRRSRQAGYIDPKTSQPAVRNPFWASRHGSGASTDPDNPKSAYRDNGIEALQRRGVLFLT